MEDEFLRNHRLQLRAARQQLFQLPSIQYFEIAGRPSLVYQIRDYSQKDSGGAAQARQDVPFLFKAFETGQVPPPRFGTKRYLEARPVTIHEYLDWTVTAVDNSAEDEIVSCPCMNLQPYLVYGFRTVQRWALLFNRRCSGQCLYEWHYVYISLLVLIMPYATF